MNESELIARYFAPLAGPAGLGLIDDAACLIPPPGCDLVLTADALVAGRHFFAEDPPDAIAAKTLGVNLSDLAAKGAEPLGYLLSLALPPDWTERFLDEFSRGLGEAAAAAGVALLGGDTVATSGPLTLSITALGAVPHGAMIRRSGARAGDLIYVTGTIGDAALGLSLRRREIAGGALPAWAKTLDAAELIDRYLRPRPRLALTPALRACARAAMDVSDGLIGDVRALMRASGVAAQLDLARLPLSAPARAALAADPALLESVVTGGDDYEIVCAVAPERAALFEQLADAAGVAVTRIGAAAAQESVLGPDGAARRFARDRFSHV
ncbi:thiamine-phosphate kinase [Rhodoblastus acidophilus]|uniref:Thiamine-monophosphate kinase n=1 Tax=Rhodoblastus acidophilus TaxID=1074 RepID=A0A212S7U2_RHOAC|nr:thiamine-phosphate kinase [Rhodoblastus acidophilus]PPQ37049.1 thiamine-phosphate kinase [Rhodoblastus acidophilus]RAI20356.1 thiamine-phosphate kinase [Rhodoblastus acidophilus]SNB81407.1 thiamine-phosphate kinase [Rhodoblastus acidophilus]